MFRTLTVIICLFFPLLVFYADETSLAVGIYKGDISVESFGISIKRRSAVYNLARYTGRQTVKHKKGLLTAVLLSKNTVDKIALLFELKDRLTGKNYILTRKKNGAEGACYQLVMENGLLIEFGVQQILPEIKDWIRKVYPAHDPARMEVMEEYEKNYVLRIYSAPDLNGNGLFDIQDASVCASLLGEEHQPLIGIHNGSGLLSKIF